MLLCVHIAEPGMRKSLGLLRAKPRPEKIDGLRYAETWLMSPFRTGLIPSTDVSGVAMVTAWESDDALDRFLDHPLAEPYADGWRARFEPVRTVGAWPWLPDLPRQERDTGDSPVAVLTMARMRLPKVPAFAAAAAPAEREAVRHPAYLGGASLMHPPSLIATLSLWRNVREMRQYTVGAYPGGHRDAMRKHDEQVFHHETVFVRLLPYAVEGQWNGSNPLDMLQPLPAG
ncbi:MAG TPA: hypothetical protein VMB79_12965 [Jatrophihabitans sp.]|nr:hypothetical protein [Jatrophihabitans sp.]